MVTHVNETVKPCRGAGVWCYQSYVSVSVWKDRLCCRCLLYSADSERFINGTFRFAEVKMFPHAAQTRHEYLLPGWLPIWCVSLQVEGLLKIWAVQQWASDQGLLDVPEGHVCKDSSSGRKVWDESVVTTWHSQEQFQFVFHLWPRTGLNSPDFLSLWLDDFITYDMAKVLPQVTIGWLNGETCIV